MRKHIQHAFFIHFLLLSVLAEFVHAAETLEPMYASLRMLWGLLIVSAIIFLLYFVLRKRLNFMQQHGDSIIKVVEIRHVLPKKSIMLIEVRGQEYLVGAGQESISSITPVVSTTSFEEVLNKTEIPGKP